MSFEGSDGLPSVQPEPAISRNHQTSAFERVLEQMVKQNEFTEKQTNLIVKALSKQTELLQKMSQTNEITGKSSATLEKLAVSGKHKNGSAALTLMIPDHSERPFPQRRWNFEPAWAGVYKSVSAKIVKEAEVWKSGLDSSLILCVYFHNYLHCCVSWFMVMKPLTSQVI